MKPAPEQKTRYSRIIYGVPMPPKMARQEGPIKRRLRAAKDGAYFTVWAYDNSNIHKAARDIGVKIETRELTKGQFGVWVRKPMTKRRTK